MSAAFHDPALETTFRDHLDTLCHLAREHDAALRGPLHRSGRIATAIAHWTEEVPPDPAACASITPAQERRPDPAPTGHARIAAAETRDILTRTEGPGALHRLAQTFRAATRAIGGEMILTLALQLDGDGVAVHAALNGHAFGGPVRPDIAALRFAGFSANLAGLPPAGISPPVFRAGEMRFGAACPAAALVIARAIRCPLEALTPERLSECSGEVEIVQVFAPGTLTRRARSLSAFPPAAEDGTERSAGEPPSASAA